MVIILQLELEISRCKLDQTFISLAAIPNVNYYLPLHVILMENGISSMQGEINIHVCITIWVSFQENDIYLKVFKSPKWA